MTSWIVIFVLSALNTGWPFASRPAADRFPVHVRGDERAPAMPHLMADLRQRVVVRRNPAVGGALAELVHVKADVVVVAVSDAHGRPLLHLICADVHRLNELPLK